MTEKPIKAQRRASSEPIVKLSSEQIQRRVDHLEQRSGKLSRLQELLRARIQNFKRRLSFESKDSPRTDVRPPDPTPPSAAANKETSEFPKRTRNLRERPSVEKSEFARLAEERGWRPPAYLTEGRPHEYVLDRVKLLEAEAAALGHEIDMGRHWSRIYNNRNPDELLRKFRRFVELQEGSSAQTQSLAASSSRDLRSELDTIHHRIEAGAPIVTPRRKESHRLALIDELSAVKGWTVPASYRKVLAPEVLISRMHALEQAAKSRGIEFNPNQWIPLAFLHRSDEGKMLTAFHERLDALSISTSEATPTRTPPSSQKPLKVSQRAVNRESKTAFLDLCRKQGWNPPEYFLKSRTADAALDGIELLQKEARFFGHDLNVDEHWSRIHNHRDLESLRKSFRRFIGQSPQRSPGDSVSVSRSPSGPSSTRKPNVAKTRRTAVLSFNRLLRSFAHDQRQGQQDEIRGKLFSKPISLVTPHSGLQRALGQLGYTRLSSLTKMTPAQVTVLIRLDNSHGFRAEHVHDLVDNFRNVLREHGAKIPE